MKSTLRAIIVALNDAQVRYLVVGGVAVVLHGYLRTTADLDLVVELDPDNLRRAISALEKLGYRPRLPVKASELADPDTRESWIRDKGMMVFSLYSDEHPMFSVDLFVEEPFDFDRAYEEGLRVPLEDTDVTVVGLADLRALKQAAGRPRDLDDLAALEALTDPGEDHEN